MRKETSKRILECCCAARGKRQGQGKDMLQQMCICNVFVALMLSHLLTEDGDDLLLSSQAQHPLTTKNKQGEERQYKQV